MNYGETRESIDNLQNQLTELGYQNGYVTVDNYDWYINSLLQNAVKEGNAIDYDILGDVYVQAIWQAIEFYDSIAVDTLGRSPKHVLLLHENDLASLYIPDLVDHIREQGWSIISPQKAYTDPISKHFPSDTYHGQGRVAAMAYESGIPEEELRSDLETRERIETLIKESSVFD